MYRALDADKIIATIDVLQRRIDERFPGAGLARVAADFSAAARDTEAKAKALARPHLLIQLAVGLVILAFVGLIAYAVLNIPAPTNTEATNICRRLRRSPISPCSPARCSCFWSPCRGGSSGTRR
ncbi:MAG: hypothetical protein ACXWVQ_00680 [Methyloceanibacter sp.]